MMKRLLMPLILSGALAACGSSNPAPDAGGPNKAEDGGVIDAGLADSGGTELDAAEPDGGEALTDAGEADVGVPTYPDGPYGYVKGDTIENISLFGYRRGADKSTDGGWSEIQLDEFFDPLGNKNVEFWSTPYKLLVVNIWGTWCDICSDEAQYLDELCSHHAQHGLVCYSVIAQNAEGGCANRDDLDWWRSDFQKMKSEAIVADSWPESKWIPFVTATKENGWPVNLFIDPRTMELLDVTSGFSVESELGLWNTIKKNILAYDND
jgi:thiol-disulfide isomerase/thioredoxin